MAAEKVELTPEVRALVQKWTADAREKGLTPEQFVVVIKREAAQITSLVQPGFEDGQRKSVIQRIITLSIEEYYKNE